jgi:hypothetical protein
MPILLRPLDSTDEPMEKTAGATPATSPSPVPTEKTLDPGETVVSSDAVDIMAQIITFSKEVDTVGVPKAEIDPGTASLIISAILIYFLIKVAFRLLPWILGIGAVILFAKMGGTA